MLLAAGLGLVAYAGVDREAGPGYLGAAILLLFTLLVGMPGEGGASLWFWPLVLLAIGGAMIAAGLRPRRELPPEPDRGGPAPVVPAPVTPPPPPPPPTPESIAAEAGAAPRGRRARLDAARRSRAGGRPAETRDLLAADAAVDGAAGGRGLVRVRRRARRGADEGRSPAEPAPEPPARGSLWARSDPGEEPTQQHRAPPRDDDDA